MTCIVGLVDNGTVWIGGDSASVSGLDIAVDLRPKVFRKDDMLIGFTWSWRMGQLLHHKFSKPYHRPDLDVMEYLCTVWIDAVRDCFKAGGFATTDSGAEKGGRFLLGYRGALYGIWQDYQVDQVAHGYDACGCGGDYALGALHATPHLAPQARINAALAAATHHSAGVCAPYIIEKQEA